MTGDDSAADPEDEAVAYARRLQAEVEAEAAERRRVDPSLEILEREIASKWENIAPLGATGDHGELLLDRLELLAHVDVDVPTGSKPGIRQVKGTLRKLNYWYLRYLADQINTVNSLVLRLLRRFEDRLERAEEALGLDVVSSGLVEAIPEPSPDVVAIIMDAIESSNDTTSPVVVMSCGEGEVVRAIQACGRVVHGVDREPTRILPGVQAGLDLRPGNPSNHLAALPEESLGALVLSGWIEDLPLKAIVDLSEQASRSVNGRGRIVVAAMDPADRDPVDRDLRAGRGVGPLAWAHLLRNQGWEARLAPVDDPRVKLIVVAERP